MGYIENFRRALRRRFNEAQDVERLIEAGLDVAEDVERDAADIENLSRAPSAPDADDHAGDKPRAKPDGDQAVQRGGD